LATTRAQLVAVDKEARCNNNARKVKVINAFETSAPGTFADKTEYTQDSSEIR